MDLVRRAVDAFNRRDLDRVMRDTDPEVEVDWSRSRGVEAGIYRGRGAARGFWKTWFEMFDRVTVVPEEFIECGEHVVMPNQTHLRGRDGVEVEAHSVSVATLRNGRIVRWALYQEKGEALEAVGLSEQDAHADS